MGVIEIVLIGLIGTLGVQLAKKWLPDRPIYIHLSVLGLCLVISLAWTLFRQYAPVEIVEMVISSSGLAIAWYEVALKRQNVL